MVTDSAFESNEASPEAGVAGCGCSLDLMKVEMAAIQFETLACVRGLVSKTKSRRVEGSEFRVVFELETRFCVQNCLETVESAVASALNAVASAFSRSMSADSLNPPPVRVVHGARRASFGRHRGICGAHGRTRTQRMPHSIYHRRLGRVLRR